MSRVLQITLYQQVVESVTLFVEAPDDFTDEEAAYALRNAEGDGPGETYDWQPFHHVSPEPLPADVRPAEPAEAQDVDATITDDDGKVSFTP